MKKTVQVGIILGMILLNQNLFGQTREVGFPEIKEKVTQKTYLDLVLNVVSTNLNYGSSNSALANYKKGTMGGQLGVSFRTGISPKVSLVSELYFLMKGGSLQAGNPLTASKSTLRLYTIELPVLARYHFGRVHVNAGPSIAYNFYGTRQIEGSTSPLSFNNTSNGFKRWDAGVQMGAGYTFNTKRKRVVVDIRYNYGLTNIAYNGEMRNRSLILAIHYSKPWKTNPFARR